MKQILAGVSAGAEVVKAPPADLQDGEKVQVKTKSGN
jgi:hypothetical protein